MSQPSPCALEGKCLLKARAEATDHVHHEVKACPDICLLTTFLREAEAL